MTGLEYCLKTAKQSFEEAERQVLKRLRDKFPIEFLNRLDKIVVFKPLELTDIVKISNLQLKELEQRLDEQGLKIKIDGEPYVINDQNIRWVVIPYLIEVNDSEFKINSKDHSEVRCVKLKNLSEYRDLSEEISKLKKSGVL